MLPADEACGYSVGWVALIAKACWQPAMTWRRVLCDVAYSFGCLLSDVEYSFWYVYVPMQNSVFDATARSGAAVCGE